MEHVNYSSARPTWRTVTTTTKDGATTEQQQLILRYYVAGKRRSKSKLFPPTADLSTERKKANAVKKFVHELDTAQEIEEAAEAERIRQQEEAEAERIRQQEEEAQRRRREKEEKAAKADRGITVADLVDKFIDDRSANGLIVPSTVSDYHGTARRIRQHFGSTYAKELRPRDAQEWERELIKSGISSSVVGKCHRLLKTAFKWGLKLEFVDRNPLDAVEPPKRVKSTPNSLDQRGAQRLTTILMNSEPSPVATGAMIALHAGLRLGEVCGLRWIDVDLDRHELHVERSIGIGEANKRRSTAFIKNPKTEASRRNIPFDNELAEVLARRMDAMRRDMARVDAVDIAFDFEELYVIGSEHGDYMHPTMLSKAWRTLAEEHGLTGTQGRRIVFHDLRHSYCTAAIEAGMDASNVAANAGHSSTKMTLDTYSSPTREGKLRTAQAVGDYMRPTKRKQGEIVNIDRTGTDD